MTKPRERPGTALQGLDLLLTKTPHPHAPDRSGHRLGMAWAAYQERRFVSLYVLRDGELIKQRRAQGPRTKVRDAHRIGSIDEVPRRLWRLYWRHVQRRETPLKDLQEYISTRTQQRARKAYHEAQQRRWVNRYRIQTDYTARGAHHQVVPRRR